MLQWTPFPPSSRKFLKCLSSSPHPRPQQQYHSKVDVLIDDAFKEMISSLVSKVSRTQSSQGQWNIQVECFSQGHLEQQTEMPI